MSKLPVVTELPIDSRTGSFSMAWRQWLQTIDRALGDAGTDTAALAAQVAAIATALGSPDGTVANIPDQDSLDFVIVNGNGISITGTPASGRVTISLAMQELAPNLVYASPASGADDVPTFRALVNADLPDMANKTIKARKTAGTGDPEDCTLSEVLDFIGSATKGDILVRDTSGWVRLAAPATGLVLTGNGAGALPTYQAPSGGGGGAMTLVGTATVAGSAATTLTLSGLNLGLYKAFFVTFALDNATASASNVSLYYNADFTATNYYRQALTSTGSAVSGARVNEGLCASLVANETATGEIKIYKDRDGKPRARVTTNIASASALILQDFGHVWDSATNVTGITLSASVANSLAIGSTFSVFGIA